jgi:hypothetical protein
MLNNLFSHIAKLEKSNNELTGELNFSLPKDAREAWIRNVLFTDEALSTMEVVVEPHVAYETSSTKVKRLTLRSFRASKELGYKDIWLRVSLREVRESNGFHYYQSNIQITHSGSERHPIARISDITPLPRRYYPERFHGCIAEKIFEHIVARQQSNQVEQQAAS